MIFEAALEACPRCKRRLQTAAHHHHLLRQIAQGRLDNLEAFPKVGVHEVESRRQRVYAPSELDAGRPLLIANLPQDLNRELRRLHVVHCTAPPVHAARPRRWGTRLLAAWSSARAAPTACCEISTPESMRASSRSRASTGPRSVTMERVRPLACPFSMRRCAVACAATWGRWVTHKTCLRPLSSVYWRPPASATAPPTPASASSKTHVQVSSSLNAVRSASMSRDASPPDATL